MTDIDLSADERAAIVERTFAAHGREWVISVLEGLRDVCAIPAAQRWAAIADIIPDLRQLRFADMSSVTTATTHMRIGQRATRVMLVRPSGTSYLEPWAGCYAVAGLDLDGHIVLADQERTGGEVFELYGDLIGMALIKALIARQLYELRYEAGTYDPYTAEVVRVSLRDVGFSNPRWYVGSALYRPEHGPLAADEREEIIFVGVSGAEGTPGYRQEFLPPGYDQDEVDTEVRVNHNAGMLDAQFAAIVAALLGGDDGPIDELRDVALHRQDH